MELHVVRPYAIPSYWTRFVGSDWGEASPWAILWLAVSPEGEVVVYRELYARKEDGYQMNPRTMMALFLKLTSGEQYRHKLLDPSCFDTVRGVSIADQCHEAGVTWERADRARISGWQRVREYLAWERDDSGRLVRPPRLEVFETCTNLIRTLPAQVYDKTNVEDLDSDGEDHACDALRYGLMSLPGSTIIPLEAMEPEYMEAILRADHEEQRDQGPRTRSRTNIDKLHRSARRGPEGEENQAEQEPSRNTCRQPEEDPGPDPQPYGFTAVQRAVNEESPEAIGTGKHSSLRISRQVNSNLAAATRRTEIVAAKAARAALPNPLDRRSLVS